MITPDEIEQRVRQVLDGLGLAHEMVEIDPQYADTAAFCAQYGYPAGAVGQHHHRRLEEGAEAVLRLRGPRHPAGGRQPHGAEAAGRLPALLRRSGGDPRAHRHDAGRRHRVRPARRSADLRGRGADVPALDHPGRRQPLAEGEDLAGGVPRAARRDGHAGAGDGALDPLPRGGQGEGCVTRGGRRPGGRGPGSAGSPPRSGSAAGSPAARRPRYRPRAPRRHRERAPAPPAPCGWPRWR